MSQEYMVLIVDVGGKDRNIDDAPAKVFMRFTEEPTTEFLEAIAKENPGKRVYSLLGASSWYQHNATLPVSPAARQCFTIGPIDIAPPLELKAGDEVVIDRSGNRPVMRHKRPTGDEALHSYILPEGCRITADGYLEIPRA